MLSRRFRDSKFLALFWVLPSIERDFPEWKITRRHNIMRRRRRRNYQLRKCQKYFVKPFGFTSDDILAKNFGTPQTEKSKKTFWALIFCANLELIRNSCPANWINRRLEMLQTFVVWRHTKGDSLGREENFWAMQIIYFWACSFAISGIIRVSFTICFRPTKLELFPRRKSLQ